MTNRRVLKWEVPVDDKDHPIGSGRVVHVECQQPDIRPLLVTVWTEEDDTTLGSPRRARVYGTGHFVPDGDVHIGTGIAGQGAYVWHVYASPQTLQLAGRLIPSDVRYGEDEQ